MDRAGLNPSLQLPQTELMARPVTKVLLIRFSQSSECEFSCGGTQINEMRGVDVAIANDNGNAL